MKDWSPIFPFSQPRDGWIPEIANIMKNLTGNPQRILAGRFYNGEQISINYGDIVTRTLESIIEWYSYLGLLFIGTCQVRSLCGDITHMLTGKTTPS